MLNIRIASANAITEIINVSAWDKNLSLLGKNKSIKPTIKGKKTGMHRILVSNLKILHLQFRCSNFFFKPGRLLAAQLQQCLVIVRDVVVTIDDG